MGRKNDKPQGPSIKKNAFVYKLYRMLNDPLIAHLIWWTGDPRGSAFRLFPTQEFCDVLSLYFKHRNVASFVRQLHMYGFQKVSDSSSTHPEQGTMLWEFRHPSGNFRQDNEAALSHIKRKSQSSLSRQASVSSNPNIYPKAFPPHQNSQAASDPSHFIHPYNSYYHHNQGSLPPDSTYISQPPPLPYAFADNSHPMSQFSPYGSAQYFPVPQASGTVLYHASVAHAHLGIAPQGSSIETSTPREPLQQEYSGPQHATSYASSNNVVNRISSGVNPSQASYHASFAEQHIQGPLRTKDFRSFSKEIKDSVGRDSKDIASASQKTSSTSFGYSDSQSLGKAGPYLSKTSGKNGDEMPRESNINHSSEFVPVESQPYAENPTARGTGPQFRETFCAPGEQRGRIPSLLCDPLTSEEQASHTPYVYIPNTEKTSRNSPARNRLLFVSTSEFISEPLAPSGKPDLTRSEPAGHSNISNSERNQRSSNDRIEFGDGKKAVLQDTGGRPPIDQTKPSFAELHSERPPHNTSVMKSMESVASHSSSIFSNQSSISSASSDRQTSLGSISRYVPSVNSVGSHTEMGSFSGMRGTPLPSLSEHSEAKSYFLPQPTSSLATKPDEQRSKTQLPRVEFF